jgi:hypothetical protein
LCVKKHEKTGVRSAAKTRYVVFSVVEHVFFFISVIARSVNQVKVKALSDHPQLQEQDDQVKQQAATHTEEAVLKGGGEVLKEDSYNN